MAYSVFAFGVRSSVLVGHTTLGASWITSFGLVLGDFDSIVFGFLEWAVFWCATILNVIIMLNLLVYPWICLRKCATFCAETWHVHEAGVSEWVRVPMFWWRSAGYPEVIFTCNTGWVDGAGDRNRRKAWGIECENYRDAREMIRGPKAELKEGGGE